MVPVLTHYGVSPSFQVHGLSQPSLSLPQLLDLLARQLLFPVLEPAMILGSIILYLGTKSNQEQTINS
jgi:hypothetical protein